MALNYTADADVDINDLEGERVRQAALMAFWNEEHHKAILAFKVEKTDFDSYEANLYLMIKAQLQERALRDGGKASVTEALGPTTVTSTVGDGTVLSTRAKAPSRAATRCGTRCAAAKATIEATGLCLCGMCEGPPRPGS